MFQALFDYFYTLLDSSVSYDYFDNMVFDIGGYSIDMTNYLSITFALISFIIILVLCCLFIYRLIRLVGRLFSGGAL